MLLRQISILISASIVLKHYQNCGSLLFYIPYPVSHLLSYLEYILLFSYHCKYD